MMTVDEANRRAHELSDEIKQVAPTPEGDKRLLEILQELAAITKSLVEKLYA